MHILNALRYKNILSEEYEARQGGARRDKKDLKIKKRQRARRETRDSRVYMCVRSILAIELGKLLRHQTPDKW